jgi:UDP-galactopyranose mutase
MGDKLDLLIGGAGIFGLTIAEQAASAGYNVLIVEQKNQIGGNVASHFDAQSGVEVHTYGSHIFHTNNEKVWDYISRFATFVPYTHRVRTVISNGATIPLPFGLATFSAYYNKTFTPNDMRELVKTFPKGIGSFEEVAIASVGEDLYRATIEGYTRKQWGRDPRDLPASVIKRLPIRYTWDDGYFTDKYQGLPKDGYQKMMERMADNPRISIEFSSNIMDKDIEAPLVFTGAIDTFFNYEFGRLGWRSIDLVEERPDTDDFQGCPVMNYGSADVPWTRIHEYKHYRPDREYNGTVIHKEYSRDTLPGETGAYPVNTFEDQEKLKKYREVASKLDGVWLGGRLGSYKYLDMHMAIASALTMWSNEIEPYIKEKNQNRI